MERENILIDIEGGERDVTAPDFDLNSLREQGLMPPDYELCGICGFDHGYDFSARKEIEAAHREVQ